MAEETTQPGRVEFGTPATDASAYPGFQPPEPHRIPSGAIFWLRRPQVFKMLRQGKLPNPLMDIVKSVFFDRDELETAALAKERGITVEEMRDELIEEKVKETVDGPPSEEQVGVGLEYMDVVVWAAIVSPEVEIEPAVDGTPLTASGALSYSALSDDDIQYILHWVNNPLVNEGVATFPQEPGQQDGGSDSGKVRPKAKRPSRAAA